MSRKRREQSDESAPGGETAIRWAGPWRAIVLGVRVAAPSSCARCLPLEPNRQIPTARMLRFLAAGWFLSFSLSSGPPSIMARFTRLGRASPLCTKFASGFRRLSLRRGRAASLGQTNGRPRNECSLLIAATGWDGVFVPQNLRTSRGRSKRLCSNIC